MGNRFSRGRRRRASDRAAFLSELTGPSARQRGKPDHKTAMLCRQVQRSLSLALGAEELLAELTVGEVRPAPNAGHLLVEVRVPSGFELPMPALLERLANATPRVRHVVAQSITRKRAPELSFLPVAGGTS